MLFRRRLGEAVMTPPTSPGKIGWLILASVIVWSGSVYFHWTQPTLFLDDAYIYLHIASNLLDTGTARFYPIADNASLLASSPLRLLILVPATELARWLTGLNASDATARLTFIFSGGITALLFLPWFWRQWRWWWGGVLFTGLASIGVLSTLQMEGALLFWCGYTLLWMFARAPSVNLIQLGLLAGVMVLARPEYGLVTILLIYPVLLAQSERWRDVVAFSLPLLLIAVAWIALASVWQVWFIPTTYLAKIMTAQLDMFSADFGDLFLASTNHYFFGNFLPTEGPWQWLIPGIFAGYGLLFARASRVYVVYLLGLALIMGILYRSPGNYLWYYENYFLVMATLIYFVVLQAWWQSRKATWLTVTSLGLVVLFFGVTIAQRVTAPVGTYVEKMGIYRSIAEYHQGHGIFQFPDLEPTYVSMMEIGVVSYFGGPTIWINDMGGLAQAGTLKGTDQSTFRHFYPPSLLLTGNAENRRLCQQTPPCRAHDAWAIQDEAGIEAVLHYDPQTKIGLNLKSIAVPSAE